MRKVSLIYLLISLMIPACMVHPPVVLEDIEYIKHGREGLQKKDYKEAREAFQKLQEHFPDSKYMAEARLGIADSYFFNEEYIEAVFKYEDFFKYHPKNPLAEQAQFRLGMSHYQQRLSLDRDQSETRKAIEVFEKFLKNFPQSPLGDDARKHLADCFLLLAEHEIYIGQFYLRKEDYYSAIGRFKYALTHYQQTPVMDRALFGLAESYWGLGKYREGYTLYAQLLASYPQSQYASSVRQRLAQYR